MVFIRSCFSLRPLQNRKLEVLWGKRLQKILRIEELTGSSNPRSLEATFKNPFGCLHNYRRGDGIDVTSASRSTTLFPVFAANHIYQKDLCRACALVHRLRRGSVRDAPVSHSA